MNQTATEMPLTRRFRNGKLVGGMNTKRTYLRSRVQVENAPSDDNAKFRFSEAKVKQFTLAGMLPLSEIRYWLLWANQLRINSGEKSFDLPTTESILGLLNATHKKYVQLPAQDANASDDMSGTTEVTLVPVSEFKNFIDNSQGLSRKELITALDKFVGNHL